MIFGHTHQQRLDIVEARRRWHPFFAWHPVQLDTGNWCWWEWVERKGSFYDQLEYRLCA
jgi:hypothetical protein